MFEIGEIFYIRVPPKNKIFASGIKNTSTFHSLLPAHFHHQLLRDRRHLVEKSASEAKWGRCKDSDAHTGATSHAPAAAKRVRDKLALRHAGVTLHEGVWAENRSSKGAYVLRIDSYRQRWEANYGKRE